MVNQLEATLKEINLEAQQSTNEASQLGMSKTGYCIYFGWECFASCLFGLEVSLGIQLVLLEWCIVRCFFMT